MKSAVVALASVIALVGGACSSDDAADSTTTTATGEETAAQPVAEPVTVLVTNDDGVDADGIDALVEGLESRDDVEVVVVAPAENQSGSGGRTTDGALVATETTTKSGRPATGVEGFPADSVVWALGEGGIEADLVISGINEGQNIGPLSPISGTVGAARQAAQQGVPALAVSQGFGEPPDYATTVEATMAWIDDNMAAIVDGSIGTETITSINAPTCEEGEPQGTVDAPVLLETDQDVVEVDCAGTAEPVDDVTAFVNGWIVVTPLEPTGSVTE